MIYVPWIIPMIWRYQLVYFIMAGLDTYVWSTAFALLLNVGFIEQRGDYCTFIAMIYLAIELFRYHIGLHYFSRILCHPDAPGVSGWSKVLEPISR